MTDRVTENIKEQIQTTKRLIAIGEAREHLHRFISLMMPDPEDPFDSDKTEYKFAPHCKLLCEIIARIEAGALRRCAVSLPPQHSKTLHLSLYGSAWILGRNPKAKIIIATYNENRAAELGEEFRKVLVSPTYQAIFKEVTLEPGSASKHSMRTTAGGKVFFVGAGGTVTGRAAGDGYFFVDDPIKDDEEIQTETAREKMWKWLFAVAYSRGNKKTRMLITHTRWHADDMIGRLCDPNHPERNKRFKGIADDWTYLNISGVVKEKKLADALGLVLTVQTDPKVVAAFGSEPMCALWEEDKDLAHFAQWKAGEPRTFSALVMGQPSIEDGEYFHKDSIVEYDAEDLPKRLTIYGASDHAVGEKQQHDYTVLGCVGVDENDDIWVLPDLVWRRMQTDKTVEELLLQFKIHKPVLWWMESELISKSFGPFLLTRMREMRIYTTIDPVPVSKDKRLRARAIQGRMSMRKVHFPRFASWWPQARSELLQFPFGAHDDFVDWLAHVGMGMLKETKPGVEEQPKVIPLVGSPQWVMRQTKLRADRDKRAAGGKGW